MKYATDAFINGKEVSQSESKYKTIHSPSSDGSTKKGERSQK